MKLLLGIASALVFFTLAGAQSFNPNYNRVIFWHDQLLQSINATGSSIFWLGELQHTTLSMAMHETLIHLGCKKTSRCHMPTANLAVDVAGQYVVKHYYGARWIGFEDILNARFLLEPSASVRETAKRVGEREAERAIKRVDTCGVNGLDTYEFAVGVEGRYQRTPPFFKLPSLQQYATSNPLVLPTPGFFTAPPIPAISSNLYKNDVNEVRLLGDVNSTTRTLYQTRLARYMDSGNFGGNLEGSIGTFTRITEQLIVQTNKNLFDSAAILRVLTTASFDRNMNHMYNKRFVFDSWRPITVIRNGAPSNPNIVRDPNWTPLLFYNSNQEYPAGHPTQSYCSVMIMRRMFGRDDFTFILPSGHAEYPFFTFNSLTHFLTDSADARIWAGLHFRFSINGAFAVADQVCGYVHDQLCQDNTCFSRP
jgi:hypothetical protein